MNARRPADCLSDWMFDRLLTGESSSPEARAHVQSCQRCSSRLQALEDEQRAFAADPPPRRAPAPRPASAKWLAMGCVLAAAAALLVLRPDPGATRIKGGARLDFFVKRGGQVFEAGEGAELRPGDLLRFRYSAPEAGWLAVLNVDAARQVSVFFPTHDRMTEVPAAVQALLPEATELDATLGEERLIGVFCAQEQPLTKLIDALRADPEGAAVSGCTFERLRVHKRGA